MSEIGYTLASEEQPPKRLVELAKAAESAGFTHAMVSDHFQPWTDRQGHSPFVWPVVGGVAMVTERIDQVGPDQEGFMRFYAAEVLPKL